MRRGFEDFPELMQNIQSRLTVKEAARTSVLSKSWLHAWSTIPTLRFDVGRGKSMKLVDVDCTVLRYLSDNIPFERFDLKIEIENHESAADAEKWIRSIATKDCLREFSLSIDINRLGASFTLPDEILSGENLTKLRVSASGGIHPVWMTTSHYPVINCASLRELHLKGVHIISEEALDHILSSCTLLVKIELLHCCKGFKTIKVKNLHRLYELQIDSNALHSAALEISGVPNLGVFSYDLDFSGPHIPIIPLNAHSISLGSSVTRLKLCGVITDNVCLDVIKLGFPFLECLILGMRSWMSESFHFTCASLKRLSLLSCPDMLIDVQVNAPKLIFFSFSGYTLPSLLFPDSSLKKITVSLILDFFLDADFFLKMREALTLSHKCYLDITTYNLKLPVDIDDLRKRLMFPPAKNVQKLSFNTMHDECMWEQSQFFYAFFEICHPKQVFARPDSRFIQNNHFFRLMLKEVLEKEKNKTGTTYWPHYLQHVQIRRYHHQKWTTLTNLQRSLLDGSAPGVCMYFKLMWC